MRVCSTKKTDLPHHHNLLIELQKGRILEVRESEEKRFIKFKFNDKLKIFRVMIEILKSL